MLGTDGGLHGYRTVMVEFASMPRNCEMSRSALLPSSGQTALAGSSDFGRVFLTQMELAHRWRLTGRTLEKWRWIKRGPPYVKLGRRVLYPLADVEAYEVQQRRSNAAGGRAEPT